MATRGAIVRVDPKTQKFKGVYHHWDSYPSGLGATLFQIYNKEYVGNFQGMLKDLIDAHPAGWSTLNTDTKEERRCYCHDPGRMEGPNILTQKDAAAVGVEYAYGFYSSPTGPKMMILSSYCPDGKKMIGYFGMGDENSSWRVIGDVPLDGPEPKWEAMEGEGSE